MGENQVFELSIRCHQGSSECMDDNGHLKQTGTVWTASAHIITALIGSGILSLAWAIAQLGWIAGLTVIFLFSFVTYYISTLLAVCYRSGDPVPCKRNYTYMDAIRSSLGGTKFNVCGLVYYVNLFCGLIGYTITSSMSMKAIRRSKCFHISDHNNIHHENTNPEIIVFGIIQIIISSQFNDFNELWWLSILTAAMSFTYSGIILCLSIAKVAETRKFRGNLTGIRIGTVTETQKIWRSLQAVGIIALAYSYSNVHFQIQDTIKTSSEAETIMNKASLISIGIPTLFYMLFGFFGYAACGDLSPEDPLTGSGFCNPYWLIDIANAAIIIHLIGACQVYCQPLFAFVEKQAAEKFPDSEFINKEIKVPIPGFKPYKLNFFRLVWRTIFVILITVISMLLPFRNDVVDLLGALGFWPLTAYFPVEMYIAQNKIPKWSRKWVCLQILSFACLIVTIAAAAGSIAGIVLDLKSSKPF